MLTQIYSPYSGKVGQPPAGTDHTVQPNTLENSSTKQDKGLSAFQQSPDPLPHSSQEDTFQRGGDPQSSQHSFSQKSSGLETVSEQFTRQVISMDAILNDFRSTLSALGADEPVKAQVESYLQVIQTEVQKAEPSAPLIKQILRTSADRLDQFITTTLKQPSNVVREWVDALLMQPIDFKQSEIASDHSAEEMMPTDPPSSAPQLAADLGGEAASQSEPFESQAQSYTGPDLNESGVLELPVDTLSVSEKSVLKQWIDETRLRWWAGDQVGSQQAMDSALTLLQEKNRPDLEGKVYHLAARLYHQSGASTQALEAYSHAERKFADAGLPHKQSHALYSMAHMLDLQGKSTLAKTYYDQALSLAQTGADMDTVSQIYNDLGSLTLQKGNPHEAVTYFLEARTYATRAEKGASLLPDIFSNLGAAFRTLNQYPKAVTAYKNSLRHAREIQDQQGYLQSLRNLAETFQEANQPNRSQELLRRTRRLEQQWLTQAG